MRLSDLDLPVDVRATETTDPPQAAEGSMGALVALAALFADPGDLTRLHAPVAEAAHWDLARSRTDPTAVAVSRLDGQPITAWGDHHAADGAVAVRPLQPVVVQVPSGQLLQLELVDGQLQLTTAVLHVNAPDWEVPDWLADDVQQARQHGGPWGAALAAGLSGLVGPPPTAWAANLDPTLQGAVQAAAGVHMATLERQLDDIPVQLATYLARDDLFAVGQLFALDRDRLRALDRQGRIAWHAYGESVDNRRLFERARRDRSLWWTQAAWL